MRLDDFSWDLAIGVMLTGVRNTIKVSRKALVDGGRGGSIIIISSAAGLKGMSDGNGGPDGYVAAKHGVVGLMRTYANVLAPHSIRVNTIHPTGVMTPMIMNESFITWVGNHPGDRRPNDQSPAGAGLGSDRRQPHRRHSWPPTRRSTSPASRCPSTPVSTRDCDRDAQPTSQLIDVPRRPSAASPHADDRPSDSSVTEHRRCRAGTGSAR